VATSQTAHEMVSVAGRRVRLTNLGKVFYPETGTTKRDVLEYYANIADALLRYTADRPATRKRWVNGVGTPDDPGEMFFQKNLDDSTPEWVTRASITHKERTNEYPLVNDLATLTWLGQIGTLEIHVPQWQFGRNGQPKNPDRLVLDLDPGEGAGLAECAEVARYAKAILDGMGLDLIPVTSGSKGIHLYAALDGTQNSNTVASVAHELARALEADHADLVVSEMKKSLRRGKVFVDWSQNNASKTTVAPYSLRGEFRPTVAAPRTWRELSSKNLRQLEYPEVLRRVARRGDPMELLAAGRIQDRGASSAAGDRLASYRSKRTTGKTPEPIPDRHGTGSDSHSFVIQEHHARALHYDFRLEHDGVLVSWALPKGPPVDPGRNHLAVQTEDHPLEYGSFEGTIPKGEYGAGQVTIWDAGTYELQKWRDGEEVIATLHGRPGGGLGGPRKYALIHTGGEGKGAKNWLIHLMKDNPKTPSPRSRGALAPMLASLGNAHDIDDEAEWAFEMKWDGIRALAFVSDGSLRLMSRNDNDVTASYPELGELVGLVGDNDAVLDGEIIALNKAGRPDFGVLQTRMKLTKPTDVRRALERTPVHYMLFDLLELNGTDLASHGYDSRRHELETLIAPATTSAIQVPPSFTGSLSEAYEASHELGLEGVMASERDATRSEDAHAAGSRSSITAPKRSLSVGGVQERADVPIASDHCFSGCPMARDSATSAGSVRGSAITIWKICVRRWESARARQRRCLACRHPTLATRSGFDRTWSAKSSSGNGRRQADSDNPRGGAGGRTKHPQACSVKHDREPIGQTSPGELPVREKFFSRRA